MRSFKTGAFEIALKARTPIQPIVLTGTAHAEHAQERVARVIEVQHASGATTSGDEIAFRLELERALYARYKPRGEPDNWPPEYFRWKAPG